MFGRQAQDGAAVDLEREGHALMRHGLAAHLLGDGHGLGALGLHELEPGRGGVEQVADLDPGAVRAGEGRGGDRALGPRLDRHLMGGVLAARAAGDGQAGDRADRGQGLAAKAQGGDAEQVDVAGVVGFELGGGVALDGQRQFLGRHALAVIGDQQAVQAPALGLD